MKKILSFVLVLAMIASMMCISVSAAEKTEADDFIGSDVPTNGSGGKDYADAKKTSDPFSVEATIGTTVVHKYAVDLTYSVSDITINGKYIWNVSTLVYELGEGFEVLSGNNALSGALSGTINVGSCAVTNYSDMPIYVSAEADYPNTQNVEGLITLDAITNTIDATAGDDLVDGNVAIADAYDEGAGVKGEAKAVSFTISLSSNNWANVANDIDQANSKIVATYTITVSATDPSVAPADPADPADPNA